MDKGTDTWLGTTTPIGEGSQQTQNPQAPGYLGPRLSYSPLASTGYKPAHCWDMSQVRVLR